MKFSIGDKSSIFKYISKNLKNLYDANLTVSNEYTIELAKCIYRYLNDNFPQQEIHISDDKKAISENIADYYLCGNSLVNNLIKLDSISDYSYDNGNLYIINRNLDRPNNEPIAVYIYYVNNGVEHFVLESYDYSLEKPIILADFPDSVSDVYIVDFYSLGYMSTVPKFNLYDNYMGARIYKELEGSSKSRPIFDTNSSLITFSIDDINEFSLIDWPIDDQIIQYLHPGVVVTETFSDIDEIAIIQSLLENSELGYTPDTPGVIDGHFTSIVYIIQYKLIKNKPVLATGYFDTYVESYIRNLCEVRL